MRPQMVSMKYIADQINAERNTGLKRRYKILMVPRKVKCFVVLWVRPVATFCPVQSSLSLRDRVILSLKMEIYLIDSVWCGAPTYLRWQVSVTGTGRMVTWSGHFLCT